MKLDDYLAENGIPRVRFAERIGISPSYVTMLCNGERYPGARIMRLIIDATDGAVGPHDFLDQDFEAAQ